MILLDVKKDSSKEDKEKEKPTGMDVFSRDSSLSQRSFNSAANYNHYNDQEMHMNKYIAKHPLTELLSTMGWNNIPLQTKEMFHLMCNAMVG